MKELKFRAWHKTKNIMLDVIAINFSLMQITADIETIKIYSELDYWWKETDIPFSEIELMQCTGLKDKNGKEIYEGDIVEYVDDEFSFIGKVEHSPFGYYVIADDSYHFEDFADDEKNISEFEIIGNIYENKELLND